MVSDHAEGLGAAPAFARSDAIMLETDSQCRWGQSNLDRVQMIKGWLDADQITHEKIYDVTVPDICEIDKEGRCKRPVGNTVGVEEATYTNAIGDPFLQSYWKIPTSIPPSEFSIMSGSSRFPLHAGPPTTRSSSA